MNNTELRDLLYREIPIASAMGVEIVEDMKSHLTIKAPLHLNRNHLETAFGGSLSTLLILSCYAWLFQRMDEKGHHCHVLIQEGHTDYLLPVKQDLVAACIAPDEKSFEKFLESFTRKGVGRLALNAEILINEGKGCRFKGVFVAKDVK